MENVPIYCKDHYNIQFIRRIYVMNDWDRNKTLEIIKKDILFRLKYIVELDVNLRINVL
jgi:hypothetical protein